MQVKLSTFKKVFVGKQFAIGLKARKNNNDDSHVIFDVLSEDDGNWFIFQHGASSYWLPDLLNVMQQAQEWCENNCIKEEYGYRFK